MFNIKQNIIFSIFSNTIQLYSGTFIIIILAKLLNLNDFGNFTFGVSLSGIICTCAEFGYSLMTLRDIPTKKFDSVKYVNNTLFQKHIVTTIVLTIGILYLFLINSEDDYFLVNIVFIVDGVIMSYCAYFISFFQAIGKFKNETYAVLLNALLLTVMLIVVKFLQLSLLNLCVLFLFTHIIRLIQLSIMLRKTIALKFFEFNEDIQRYLVKNSWSFGLHYIIGIFYFTIDSQLIYFYLKSSNLALYNSVFRIVSILLLASSVLIQVFLPYLAQKYQTQDKSFSTIVVLLLNTLLLQTYLFSLIIVFFDKNILSFLYKEEYLEATKLFVPLLSMCSLRSAALLFGMLLTISDRQVYRLSIVILSLIVSFFSNAYLIPLWGIMGAAFASVITHAFLLLLYIYYANKIYIKHFINYTTVYLMCCIITVPYIITNFKIDYLAIMITLSIVSLIPIVPFFYQEKQHITEFM